MAPGVSAGDTWRAMSQENVDAVRTCLDGWNRGDVEAWLRDAHPEIEWYSAVSRAVEGADTRRRGLAEMRAFWDEWHSVWDLHIDIAETRDLGDTVLALGSMRTRGEASGIDLESPVGYVFEFEGRLARKVSAYRDHAEALEAVGLRE
jgi:ketosteroid isomerase-like protein